jgi:hypothetical protein
LPVVTDDRRLLEALVPTRTFAAVGEVVDRP